MPGATLPGVLGAMKGDAPTHLVAIGKAAASMAQAALEHHGRIIPGIVLTRYGHVCDGVRGLEGLEIIEAGHPVPDAAGREAAEGIFQLASALGPDDHLLMLVSGGGSALFARPAAWLALEEKQHVTRALLASGASISEINCVRKHLSSVKGGRLAVAAAPAKATTLILSDVPGDDPALVASGPTLPDSSTLAQAQSILLRYGIDGGPGVAAALGTPANETPGPGHPALAGNDHRIIACAGDAVAAASAFLQGAGYRVVDLGPALEGEAKDVGRAHAELALRHVQDKARVAIVSGGELTVTIGNGGGEGGPNAEYLMGLALGLRGAPEVHALACDTDGIDGTQDNAGAVIDPSTLSRAHAAGIDFAGALERHDSYSTFSALGDLVVTGPTLTNVNDLRIILIDPANVGATPC